MRRCARRLDQEHAVPRHLLCDLRVLRPVLRLRAAAHIRPKSGRRALRRRDARLGHLPQPAA